MCATKPDHARICELNRSPDLGPTDDADHLGRDDAKNDVSIDGPDHRGPCDDVNIHVSTDGPNHFEDHVSADGPNHSEDHVSADGQNHFEDDVSADGPNHFGHLQDHVPIDGAAYLDQADASHHDSTERTQNLHGDATDDGAADAPDHLDRPDTRRSRRLSGSVTHRP